ncbi:hypothetical protein [Nitrospira sp. Ecomares 2.1]
MPHLSGDHKGGWDLPLQKTPESRPNLNAQAEPWVRSVNEEVLSELILFGKDFIQHALKDYDTHYHQKGDHQRRGNEFLIPQPTQEALGTSPIRTRGRLGRLLKYYSGASTWVFTIRPFFVSHIQIS